MYRFSATRSERVDLDFYPEIEVRRLRDKRLLKRATPGKFSRSIGSSGEAVLSFRGEEAIVGAIQDLTSVTENAFASRRQKDRAALIADAFSKIIVPELFRPFADQPDAACPNPVETIPSPLPFD